MIQLNYPFPEKDLLSCREIISRTISGGGIVIYPTETLYAIGGNALDEQVAQRLSRIKQRPADKPFPCLAGNLEIMRRLSQNWPPGALQLAQEYWPGALTMILAGLPELPDAVLATDGGVALRWSPHPLLRELATFLPVPLIATSANLSGRSPARLAAELDRQLTTQADLLIVADPAEDDRRPSTIVDARYRPMRLVRAGKIKLPEIHFS